METLEWLQWHDEINHFIKQEQNYTMQMYLGQTFMAVNNVLATFTQRVFHKVRHCGVSYNVSYLSLKLVKRHLSY